MLRNAFKHLVCFAPTVRAPCMPWLLLATRVWFGQIVLVLLKFANSANNVHSDANRCSSFLLARPFLCNTHALPDMDDWSQRDSLVVNIHLRSAGACRIKPKVPCSTPFSISARRRGSSDDRSNGHRNLRLSLPYPSVPVASLGSRISGIKGYVERASAINGHPAVRPLLKRNS